MLKKIFNFFFKKKQTKTVSLLKDEKFLELNEDFPNIKKFLNSKELEKISDSRSTKFFKEASEILEEDLNSNQNADELLALQNYISKNDEVDESIVTFVPEEEKELFSKN